MIQIFDIKKKVDLNVINNNLLEDYKNISSLDSDSIFKKYNTRKDGLSNEEAHNRIKKNGLNIVIRNDKKSWLYFLLMSFKDQFILILLFLAVINFLLGDKLGSVIIVFIALISAFIRFYQDYNTYKFNLKLKDKIHSNAVVLRNKIDKVLNVEKLVVGDVIKLNAGFIIPADVIIIESKDLFLNESIFTGESNPVEKKVTSSNKIDDIFDIENICFMGSSVVSGSATAIVISTGLSTYLGYMGKEIDNKKEVTNFDIGMKHISKLLFYYMLVVCLFVLVIDGVLKGNFREAILFALSAAVGITPSMLPMIVNVNLTKGSKVLASKKTLVKRIESIQNLGAIDILCTDKTGTLTEGNIILQKYINAYGEEDLSILENAYLNSYFGTGMKNIIDKAVIAYSKKNNIDSIINEYEKTDEIPFDYSRRKMSIMVKKDNSYKVITKGALEEIIKECAFISYNGKIIKINDEISKKIKINALKLENDGMQVIAISEKSSEKPLIENEKDMIFTGFVGFLDPPREDAKKTLDKLKSIGISIKILTGDNKESTEVICNAVGLSKTNIVLGNDIDNYNDEELSKIIEKTDIFARLNPLQKERVVSLYRKNGHVVGYMGDGVNDAPSLHQADIGLSVDGATDIAKEASDIMLLEKSLDVVYDGVIEGRKVYGNIIKYMKMALSADFGDVFSILIASIFLPFLPLIPIQMLIQDFIYDFSQIGIPYDDVDEEFLKQPKKWDTKGISKFMKVMGITSSIFDVISFAVFWYIFKYNSPLLQSYFQTAWFVLCLTTELMIIHNVRTSKKPFIESSASKPLMLLTGLSLVLTIITPMILSKLSLFNFVMLPFNYYIYLFIIVILYYFTVTLIKKIYIRKVGNWL